MSKELNKAPVEQAGGDERAVDGKPRATKCPDCGEGDLMPGDLCACGYETDPAAGYACSECDGSGDGYVGEVCRECDGSGWFVTPEQARAALAQPSGEVVVTKNESGAIVSVTRQDKEGRVLSVIAESATLTAQAEQAEAERPEVVAWQYRVTAGPQTGWSLWHPGKGEEFERSYTVERRPLMTVAQHERIVGELRAVIAQLRQHKNDYMDSGQETYRALQNEIREREAEIARLDGLVSGRTAERDAALARVAELERQEPVALANRGLHAFWVKWTEAAAGLYGPGIKLYTAPVAQAQHSVPEGWMLVECGIWTQEQVDEMQKTVARFRNSEFVDDRALAMAVADAGQCKAQEISLAELLAAEAQALRDERDSQQRVAIKAMEELAALHARVVVVPERDARRMDTEYPEGWNDCLDELARLNGKTVSEGLLRGMGAFAQEIISGALEGGKFDGADLQESAERHGLIAKQVMNEPCRGPEEYCACAWSTSFPTECYRITAELRALLNKDKENGNG